jgi:thymidine kinase
MGQCMTDTLSRPGRGAGWIEVIVGSMFSGKTEELIRRLRRAQIAKQRIQVFKPKIDNRYSSDQIASHSEQRTKSVPVGTAKEILNLVADTTRVVGIDEGQFFDPSLVEVCQKLADRGIRVIVAGLDTDWQGRPFEPMPQLMAVAEIVLKSNAICVVCGGLASRTQRLSSSTARVQVGAAEMYEARCRGCFTVELPIQEKQNKTSNVTKRKRTQPLKEVTQ